MDAAERLRCIWGFGFNDNNHNFSSSACLDVINWFKGQGCYVIGGVPTWWRQQISDSRPNFLSVYSAFNMLSPWMVGRIGNVNDSDFFYNNVNIADQAYCNTNGIDYQPCVLPGDLLEHQRAHGDFMWHQFYNMVRAGCQGIYISMYDEFNEGNQIVKTAENASQIPTNAGLVGLDEDGTAVSSDYYLRLTADGGRMLKGQIPLTAARPTPYFTGGGTSGVTFYQDINYGGTASQVLPVGNYTLSQLAALGVANDWASSVRIPAGRTVIMYQHDNFTGTSWTLTADTPHFGLLSPNANDQVSSCRVQ